MNIEKLIKILNIFKNHLVIEISNKPIFDGTYPIRLKYDEYVDWDYTIIYVSKEERDLLNEWIKERN